MRTIRGALCDAVSGNDEVGWSLNVDQVIKRVFSASGQRFFFLFNQNIRRTNLQIAELISLIRLHCKSVANGKRVEGLEFSTFSEIKELVDAAYQGVGGPTSNSFAMFCNEIEHFLDNKIIIETFHGSACVYLPIGIEISEEIICGESGYIHSCGELLLVRNSSKATVTEFENAVLEALSLRSKISKFMIVPYCHEDFSIEDRNTTPFLNMGLDDVKINVSKAYVGSKKLYEVIDEIAELHSEQVIVAPSNYRKTKSEFEEHFPGQKQNTIWIISESEHRLPDRFPSEKKYYIVYLQKYKNSNYYHLYDENKPAWASHTTLPHSLAGAMLNLARPWFDQASKISIADSFCGSGTLLFEAQKFGDISCVISDRAQIFDYVVKDNATFFNLNLKELKKIHDKIMAFKDEMPDDAPLGKRESAGQKLHRIRAAVALLSDACGGDFLQAEKSDLKTFFFKIGGDLADRMLAYVIMRVRVRGAAEIARQSKTWLNMYRREIGSLIDQIENHRGSLDGNKRELKSNPNLLIVRGSYSDSLVAKPPKVQVDDIFATVSFHIADIEKLPVGSFDAIIADPPYGFNTDEGYWELSAFMKKMVSKLVLGLKPTGGQLILAAPQQSFSGRTVIPFVRSLTLGREIIRFCNENDRECVVPALVTPQDIASVRPPYYWIAEKTLQRKILHFWIRTK